MAKLSTYPRTELAHRSNDRIDVTLFWVPGDDEDKTVVCVCHRREGAYFEIPTEPHLASTAATTSSPTGTSAPSTTKTVASRRSPR